LLNIAETKQATNIRWNTNLLEGTLLATGNKTTIYSNTI